MDSSQLDGKLLFTYSKVTDNQTKSAKQPRETMIVRSQQKPLNSTDELQTGIRIQEIHKSNKMQLENVSSHILKFRLLQSIPRFNHIYGCHRKWHRNNKSDRTFYLDTGDLVVHITRIGF